MDVRHLGRRLRQVSSLLLHYPEHARYIREMARYRQRGLLKHKQDHHFKYLGEYGALSFSLEKRRLLILNHYRFVDKLIFREALPVLLKSGIALWSAVLNQRQANILLNACETFMLEGEWEVRFVVGDKTLSTLRFSLTSEIGSFANEQVICLIGAMQGGKNCQAEIREAARANYEIAPAAMCMLAVRAICAAFGVRTIVGVSSREQVSSRYAGNRLMAEYDAFWISEGATPRADGLFAMPVVADRRRLIDVPRAHRRRTKIKRLHKATILEGLAERAKTSLVIGQ